MTPLIFALVAILLSAVWGPLGTVALAIAVGLLWKRVKEIGERQSDARRDDLDLRALYKRVEGELRALKPPTDPRPARELPTPPPRPLPPQLPLREEAPETGVAGWLGAAPAWLTEFFTTGNVVAKVGMVIVFFGVAFLVRYAADRGLLPIEYRLMATVAGALVLLGVGWRLRRSQPEYAVVLQGGAVGLLYLTIFAAFRLYELLPPALTFALLIVVVIVSGLLAVLQNAMPLAVLGTSGGFLAPILASTGGGSHVALFSYYAVLNAGVLGIAWFRAWRFLNWLAFVFTFGIGFVWGQQYYQPELFATTEPFLAGFFLLFLAVAVLFAHRQPPHLRGYVDGSLVFGAPAIAFGMQSVLVRDVPFGRAYSAAIVSALYLGLARWLWHRDLALRPLAEAFLALAAVFLTLAVPFAFAGHATAAAWALEGAGLVWIGVRQHRVLARLAGSALLLGAGVAFGVMAATPPGDLPVLNSRFLGGAAIAVGSLLAGHLLSKARGTLRAWEDAFEWGLLAWGLLWSFGAVLAEIAGHVSRPFVEYAMLFGASAGGCLIGLLARRLNWRAMILAVMPIGPLLWISIVPAFIDSPAVGPFRDLGWLAWPVVVAGSYLLVFWFESAWPSAAVKAWHAGTTWLLVFLATWAAAVAARELVPETPTWSSTIWCVVPAMILLALVRAGNSTIAWPLRRFPSLYAGPIAGALTVAILMWVAWACFQPGAPAPLPYVPLLNPLELTQAFGLIAGFAWWTRQHAEREASNVSIGAMRPLLAVLAFIALNMVVGRIVHFYLRVPFDADDLLRSYVFQAGISILWGLTAGALMTLARLRLDRAVWTMGAALLAALILKLFAVDLGNAGGVARIVSFLATGIVILVIGYFAPVPPKTERAA